MKAAVYTEYGPPDVIRVQQVEPPVPADNEVLIEVHTASVNPYDWHFVRGRPYFLRLFAGLRKPKSTRFGVDAAGVVETVGREVKQFKPGDAVFGGCRGAFAEYACAAAASLVKKPESMTFEQAATIPIAGLTALQGLRDKGGLQTGQRVLVNGAAGGVGTFAVQIAKSFGAGVTGVCSTRNVEMVRSLGADNVVDYTSEDFTRCESRPRFDLIFDLVANHSLRAFTRVLAPKGIYVGAGGAGPEVGWGGSIIARMLSGLALSPFVSQKLSSVLAKMKAEDLSAICDLIAAGKVTPVIDRHYPLDELPDAIRYLETGHARGKVVIDVLARMP
jgi:NADPH:quinone reductase-like Zn-dependent oxidoreductase